MSSTPSRVAGEVNGEGAGGLAGSFVFSYLVGIVLFGALVYFAGIWEILANTRLLALLIVGGIVQLTDLGQGVVEGVPDLDYYVRSQEPIDWTIVLLALGIFLLVWATKAVQFDMIARFCGIQGSSGQHVRAYLYGLGLSRLLPYNTGNVATASALKGQGASLNRAALAVFISDIFILFEIAAFALISVFLVGWATWLSQIFWALAILGVIYLFMRRSRRREPSPDEPSPDEPSPDEPSPGTARRFETARQVFGALAQRPVTLVVLCVLSLISFELLDIGTYLTTMAFSSELVILDVEPSLLLMGLVGGYIARSIPLSPGGIGQFEWGFVAALVAGGVAFTDAATIAILVNVMRFVAVLLLLGSVTLRYGIETNLRRVFELLRGSRTETEEAAS